MNGNIDRRLYQQCQACYNDLLASWQQLVNIDSGTGDGTGLTKVGRIVQELLEQAGAAVSKYPVAGPDEACHIVGTFTGSGQGKILTMAHLDTVFPSGTAAGRPFRIEGNRAYGPGVSDCKGGVTLGLYAVKILQQLQYEDYAQITCLFNCDEEIGSPSSKELIGQLAREHDYVLCLEPGQVGDGVVSRRKGSSVMRVEVRGRAAHAGSEPHQGRNAILELMNQINQLNQLAAPAKETTLTFTTFHAGDRINVVPDYAVAQADIRVACPGELDRLETRAQAIARQTVIADTQVSVGIDRQNPSLPSNAGTDALIARAQAIYGELGKELKADGAGGASDANWAAPAGKAVLDGLGFVKGGANHTENENTLLDSVIPRLYLLTRLLMELGRQRLR
ncbi:glutamate carboxypeptidase [Sporomusa aerivorans]|uniref:glutamate carboxypeptidase n=1 Tax=Sporomusa aerivorans TaxID=204936 RepID=UPI00352A0144